MLNLLICVVMDVWFLMSLLTCQSGEICPDIIILVLLFDKLLIQKSALKICFQEQGCLRFRRFSNNQLKGQLCFTLQAAVFQSKCFMLQCFQVCVKHCCYMFCLTSLESTGKSFLQLLSHCPSFMEVTQTYDK